MSDETQDFDYGEKQEDGQYENYPTVDDGEFKQTPRTTYVHDGCGEATTMSQELSESVARDPTHYDKTFCAACGEHVPVSEVTWDDGEDWVVDSNGIGSVYVVAHSENPAPSEGHDQALDVAQYITEETDLRLRGQFLTLDEDKFEELREGTSDEWPSPDFSGGDNDD